MNNVKRTLAIAIVLVTLLTMLPISAYAANPVLTEGKQLIVTINGDEFGNGYTKTGFVEFTPTETAFYEITMHMEKNGKLMFIYGRLYMTVPNAQASVGYSYLLNAGTKYTFEYEAYKREEVNNYYVEAKKVDFISISEKNAVNVSMDGFDSKILEFKPDVSGTYDLISNPPGINGSVYDYNYNPLQTTDSSDEWYFGSNITHHYYEVSKPYYIYVMSGADAETFPVSMKLMDFASNNLELGKNLRFTNDTYNSYFGFTPKESGSYTFNFTTDTWFDVAMILDSSGEWYGYGGGKDAGEKNYTCDVDLIAGKNYNILVRCVEDYQSDNNRYVSNCTVSVTKTGAPVIDDGESTAPPTLAAAAINDETDSNITVGVHLKWDAVKSAKYYRIYRTITGKSDYKVIADAVTGTTFVDLDIEPNTSYTYKIVPLDDSKGEIDVVIDEKTVKTGTGEIELLPNAEGEMGKPKSYILMQIDNPNMNVNGTDTEVDPGRGTAPMLRKDRTMLPIRSVTEAMSGTVGWEGATQKVSLEANSSTVEMWIGSMDFTANGNKLSMDIAPFVENDRTFLPLRFAAENLNCRVTWINATKEILIVFNGEALVRG